MSFFHTWKSLVLCRHFMPVSKAKSSPSSLCFDKPIQALPLKPLNTIYAYFYTWFNTHSGALSGTLFVLRASGSIKKKKKKSTKRILNHSSKNHECKNECQGIQFVLVYSSSVKPLSGRHTLFWNWFLSNWVTVQSEEIHLLNHPYMSDFYKRKVSRSQQALFVVLYLCGSIL